MVIAVLAGTLLVLIVAALLVPMKPWVLISDGRWIDAGSFVQWGEYRWVWESRLHAVTRITQFGTERSYWWVHWPILLTEHALILLLGGGLLTVVVRRERWRKAGSAEA